MKQCFNETYTLFIIYVLLASQIHTAMNYVIQKQHNAGQLMDRR